MADQELQRTDLPIRQGDPSLNAVYVWQRIDPSRNRLISDKLILASRELRKEIAKTSQEIRHTNGINFNKSGAAFPRMWAQKVDDHASKCYGIFCNHWNLLGETKTGAFVRAVSAILLRQIERLGSTAAYEASREHRRMGSLGTSLAGSYKTSTRAICDRWRTKLDIEARDLDLVAASHKSLDFQTADYFGADNHSPVGLPTAQSLTAVVGEPHENTACGLGEWAENRLSEFKDLVHLVRSGGSPECFREQFSILFTEVIDNLQPTRRERLFKEAKGGLMRVPDLMVVLAEIKHLAGATLMDYRKQYRQKNGRARSRRPKVPSTN